MSDASQENQFIVARKEVSLAYSNSVYLPLNNSQCLFWYLNALLKIDHLIGTDFFSQALYFYQVDGRGPCLAFEGISDM